MSNVAAAAVGAKAIAATSSDPRFPVSNVLDGEAKTCWITTGLFPQEFLIAFPDTVSIARIRTQTRNVKSMAVEYCDQRQPTSFNKLYGPVEVEDASTGLQIESQQFRETKCRYLKIKILSGYSDFAVVYTIEAEGGI
uniref:F5/8 type C domain-containing protein n=1 Tax=Lotharella oceanica TaxID=641309 RepID=A0A7S2XA20_9EUKA|eukprot:CAMPEP_0170177586 /NCGR_PEP_ID=MMETSP0040_2-20121228/10553_1 /TAXON_ID=641309 /ORGANISM="Lotharella oceanica, Strain CCMP622" /LENGTH=137 /DNA_ID=CAMNT_0010420271 /DNA_START=36 /DNA_END=449 /DNA_ORIENTATION=+